MIVVDTNVVSEMMRAQPDRTVATWFHKLQPADLALSVVTLFELRYGMALLPTSAERRRLENLLERFEAGSFGKVLPVDRNAAHRAAEFRSTRRRMGRPVSVPDSLIAGIALGSDASLATRNGRDFLHAGLVLIDPFESQSP